MTTADLLMLAPWLVFGAGLGAIGVRLLRQRDTGRGRGRDIQLAHPPRPDLSMRDHGTRAADPGLRPDGRREGG